MTGTGAIPRKDPRLNQGIEVIGADQLGGELSSFRFGHVPTPPNAQNTPSPSSSGTNLRLRINNTFSSIPSDPRIKIGVIQSDMPPNI